MSNLKFLFLFEIIPTRRKFCFTLSMKLANQTMSLIILAIIICGFTLDYKYSSDNTTYTFIKYLIFSLLNFISCYFIFKSSKNLTYKDAYIGHLVLFWSFIFHIFIFFINIIFSTKFFPFASFLTKILKGNIIIFFSSIMPQLSFLILEFIFLWMCYLYTKNLGLGKDALVDGQTFDKYIEDLASSENSKHISPRNSDINISISSLENSLNVSRNINSNN